MWKYWVLSVVLALMLGWGVLQYVGDGHVASWLSWYVIPAIAALVTAVAFEVRVVRHFYIGSILIALGGIGSGYWPLLALLLLVGLGILATAIAAWLVRNLKLLA